jgi:polysaccharide pyruvyl transferase WcaK-like protein
MNRASDAAPARIVMLGTHGQYNIGDELLLATFLHQLGAQHAYVVNTYDPADTASRIDGAFNVELINTAGDRRALLRALRRADAVVFAGGSIIKELSAATGRNRYSTLLMILAVVTVTRWIARAPMAMLNIGVGPIRTRLGRRLAGLILAQVELVTVRDAGSAALCERIGVKREVVTSTDAVFSVTPEWLRGAPAPAATNARSASAATDARRASHLRIALSLNHDIDVPENWEHVMTTLAAAFTELGATRPIEVHGVPMQSRGKTHDDASVLRDFASRVPGVTFVEHLPTNHHEVAAIIEQCDVLVAERLHAIISSAKLGVPVVPLAYDVKVRQVATSLGLDHLSVDLSVPITAEQVRHSIERVADDLEAAQADLTAHARVLTVQAWTSFDLARTWLSEAQR